MKQLSKFLIAFLMVNLGFSQSPVLQETDSTFLTFKMGQSSTNSFTKSEPFQFLATFPKNDTLKNSWLINSYAELAWNNEKSGFRFGIVGEVQKNTLIEKVQDVRQFGVSFSKDIRIPFNYEVDGKIYKATKGVVVISGSIKSSNDLVLKKRSGQAHIGFSYSSYRNPNTWLSSDIYYPSFDKGKFGRIMLFNHTYNFGLGYLGGNEKVLYGKADFQITTFLLGGLMCKTLGQYDFLKIKYNVSTRTPFSGAPISEQNPLRVFSAGVNYKINETNAVELSYNWNKGADPFAGLANQNYETILIKLKISLNNSFINIKKRKELMQKKVLNNCGKI